MSRFVGDMRGEKAVAVFLDQFLYARLRGATFERVYDSARQHAGTDVIGQHLGQQLNIDEKSALYYMDKNIPTFAFELSFLNRDGVLRNGWFLNDELDTTHYMLNWLTTDSPPGDGERHPLGAGGLTVEHIVEVESLLFDKKELRQELETRGLGKNFLEEEAEKLREQADKDSGTIIQAIDGQPLCKFFVSPASDYSERPINIIIRKELLQALPGARHYKSKRNGVRKL